MLYGIGTENKTYILQDMKRWRKSFLENGSEFTFDAKKIFMNGKGTSGQSNSYRHTNS